VQPQDIHWLRGFRHRHEVRRDGFDVEDVSIGLFFRRAQMAFSASKHQPAFVSECADQGLIFASFLASVVRARRVS
jgi:hypothetical protein